MNANIKSRKKCCLMLDVNRKALPFPAIGFAYKAAVSQVDVFLRPAGRITTNQRRRREISRQRCKRFTFKLLACPSSSSDSPSPY